MTDIDMTDIDWKIIDRMIADAISSLSPFRPVPEVTAGAVAAVERRLWGFPDVCHRSRVAEGADALLLDLEIRAVKSGLAFVAGDPYYRILPDYYFHGLAYPEIADRLNCDKATVQRHKGRLLRKLALRLYGVEAWEM
jgi:hypothetical protein